MDAIRHDSGEAAASHEAADAHAAGPQSLAADLRAPTISRAYQCQCGRPVFLGNSQCLACCTPLGYVTERLGVGAARAGRPTTTPSPIPSPSSATPAARPGAAATTS